MARKTRVCFPGAIYHVMARGNERARIFHSGKDYALFLEALDQACERHGVELHAYCLMPNHVHLAIQTPKGNLSRFMALLQTTFTVRYNRNHRRSGHLFQGRYRAELVDRADYGRWLILYIHLNPIRSRKGGEPHYTGGLKKLNGFPWSSHQDYAGLRVVSKRLNMEWLAEWGRKASGARKAYLQEIRVQMADREPFDWKTQVKMGLVAGDEKLQEKVRQLLEGKGKEVGREARKKLAPKPVQKVGKVLEGEADFRVRIWIRVKLLGESQVALAKEFGYKSNVSIHQIAKRVEEKAGNHPGLKTKLKELRKLLIVND